MIRNTLVSCLFVLGGCAFDLGTLQANPVADGGMEMPLDDGGLPATDDAQVPMEDGGMVEDSDAGTDAGTDAGMMVEDPDGGTMPCTGRCLDPVSLATGRVHTCALYASGEVACWGGNGSGQFGDGTRVGGETPRLISGITDAVEIEALHDGTCARHTDGTVSCWGQLQDGAGWALTPTLVAGIVGADEIAAGAYHVCAIISGSVSCWYYQMGLERTVPVTIAGITNAVEIGAGSGFTCVRRATGQVSCWGENNSFGQLGDGTMLARPTTPGPVSSISSATHLSVGDDHSCVLQAGEVYCWGRNRQGQIGSGSAAISALTPQRVPDADAVLIAAGRESTCVIQTSGQVLCWGDNTYGQMGDGNTTEGRRLNPSTPVTGIVDADAIQSSQHVCTIRSTGQIVCWGLNNAGQLGNGTTVDSAVPVIVSPPT